MCSTTPAIMYRTLFRNTPRVALFHPPFTLLLFLLAQLLLAGQTGLLSCSYSSCIHTFRAYQQGLKRNYWGSCCTCTFLFFSRFSRSRPHRRPHPPLPSFPLPFIFPPFSPFFVSTRSVPKVGVTLGTKTDIKPDFLFHFDTT